jgi:peptidyl-prolyl cis-trans isomerase D
LQKHRRWLFVALLFIIVVPFVFTIGASPGIGGNGGGKRKYFFEINLGDRRAVEDLQRQTFVSLYLNGASEASMEQAMCHRALWLWVANRLQIPRPSEEQFDAFLRDRPAFLVNEKFSQKKYGEFLDALERNMGLSESLASRVIADDWRINLLVVALSAMNFTRPIEASIQMQQMQTEWSVDVATVPLKNFNPSVEVSEDDLRQYFESHHGKFTTEEKIALNCAFFPVDASAVPSPSDGELKLFREANGELFDLNGIGGKTSPQERSAVEKIYRQRQGEALARERANNFLELICRNSPTVNDSRLAAWTEKAGGNWRNIGEVSIEKPSAIPTILFHSWEQLAKLTDENFFSDPISDQSGIYIFFLRERIPPQLPSFDAVRHSVEECCKNRIRIGLFTRYAQEIREKLVNSSANSAAFTSLAKGVSCDVQHFHCVSQLELAEKVGAGLCGEISKLSSEEISPCISEKPDMKIIFVRDKSVPVPDAIPPETLFATYAKDRIHTLQSFIGQFAAEMIYRELR